MRRMWIYLFSALYALVFTGVYQVEGVEVFTSSELEAVNGTEIRLKCTFKSTHPLSEVRTTWSFMPLGETKGKPFFHYQRQAYLPFDGLLKNHVVWSGDVMKGDGSITLQDVQFSFNGTYSCQVLNPPDIQCFAGEIKLRVVQKVSFSEIGILAIAVGGSIGVILLILIIYIVVRVFRRRDEKMAIEDQDHGSKVEEHGSKDQVL